MSVYGEDHGEVRVTDPETGGQKGIKPERFDLIPWDAMEEVARVYHYGAQKYDDHNWAKGYKWSLSIGAMFRHMAQFTMGRDRDSSGCLHVAHAAFHCLTLIAYVLRKVGTDDRSKVPCVPVYSGAHLPDGYLPESFLQQLEWWSSKHRPKSDEK